MSTIRLNVERVDPETISVSVVTDDGEVAQMGAIRNNSEIPFLTMHVSAFVSVILTNAIWEARTGA